jgi:predicted transport protein
MDLQNLQAALFGWNTDLKMNFEPTRTKNGLINEVLAIGHSDNDDVVEGIYSIEVSE